MTPGRRSRLTNAREAAPAGPAAAGQFSARSRLPKFSLALRFLAALSACALLLFGLPAFAAEISNPVASFAALDKITARITTFDAYINETVQFGSLQITPRVCYTRPETETTQRTSVFVEVDQVSLKGATQRIFTGWMFADSPALNAVDNAVYDFWLVACKQHTDVPPPTATTDGPAGVPTAPGAGGKASGTASATGGAPAATEEAQPAPCQQANAPAPEAPNTLQVTSGSFTTLLSPTPTAEASPDAQ
jgi:hypothetical protein